MVSHRTLRKYLPFFYCLAAMSHSQYPHFHTLESIHFEYEALLKHLNSWLAYCSFQLPCCNLCILYLVLSNLFRVWMYQFYRTSTSKLWTWPQVITNHFVGTWTDLLCAKCSLIYFYNPYAVLLTEEMFYFLLIL